MTNNILITGAAGFVGSFLCEELVSRGYHVLGVDNFFRGKKENLEHLRHQSHFNFIEIDLTDVESSRYLNEWIKQHNIQTVFHLAAINGTQYFYECPLSVLDKNIIVAQNVLAAIKDSSVNYFIYTSSSEVYGEPLVVPTKEEHPILLNVFSDRDSYAASKAIVDFYVRLFAGKNQMDFLVLRVFNLYGERMVNTRYGQVIPEFIKRLLYEDEFTIIGDGRHTRSFCYIQDAILAMKQLFEKRVTGILNLGNNDEISILELARKMHQLENRAFNPVFLPERPYDHKRRCPDITALKIQLPQLQFTPLDSGLKTVIDFYKKAKA